MYQKSELGINCPVHGDCENAILVCFSRSCKSYRIFCESCNRNEHPSSCRPDHYKFEKIISKFQEIEKQCESLEQDLKLTAGEIRKLFDQIIQIITKKYQYSKQRLEELNSKQLHQALDNVIKYDEFENNYFQDIKNLSKNLIKELQTLLTELKLEEEVGTKNYFYQKGQSFYENDNYEQAIEQLDMTLLIDSNHVNSLYLKADCLRLLGNYTDAITLADKSLCLDSNNVNSLNTKADALLMLGNHTEALLFADKALQIDPKHPKLLRTKGESLRQLGQYENSITILDQALDQDPNDSYSLASKGACLQKLKKYNEAIQSYNKALQNSPSFQWAQDRKNECEKLLQKKS